MVKKTAITARLVNCISQFGTAVSSTLSIGKNADPHEGISHEQGCDQKDVIDHREKKSPQRRRVRRHENPLISPELATDDLFVDRSSLA